MAKVTVEEIRKKGIEITAAKMWHSFDANEKAGVRFGMFPFAKMQAAEKEGFNSRDLCVALMNCAKADGGMRG